jgi:hypothetical protein
MTEVEHRADTAGRESKPYRETRRQLRDDYTTILGYERMEEVFSTVAKTL